MFLFMRFLRCFAATLGKLSTEYTITPLNYITSENMSLSEVIRARITLQLHHIISTEQTRVLQSSVLQGSVNFSELRVGLCTASHQKGPIFCGVRGSLVSQVSATPWGELNWTGPIARKAPTPPPRIRAKFLWGPKRSVLKHLALLPNAFFL